MEWVIAVPMGATQRGSFKFQGEAFLRTEFKWSKSCGIRKVGVLGSSWGVEEKAILVS